MVKTNVKSTEEKKSNKRLSFKIAKEPYTIVVPEGFTFSVHKPLKKKNFVDEALFYDHKAAEMEFKREKFAAQAEECRKSGSPKQRAAKKRIIKLSEKMNELKKQLAAQGINVAELLSMTATE